MQMSRETKPIHLLTVAAVCFFAGLTVPAAQARQDSIVPTAPRTKWEYKVIIPRQEGPDLHEARRSAFEQQLNELGALGWEAVESPYLKGVRYQVTVLKREVRQ